MLKITKKISLIIALLFTFQISSPVFAARSVNELKKEIQKRSESIKETEKEINAKKAEKNEAQEKRNRLDLQISAMLDDIEDVQSVIDEKQAEIDTKNAEIEELTNQIEQTDATLKDRMVIMYEYGTSSYLDLLLNSNGLSDLITRISVIKQIYQYDKQVIADFVATRQKVEDAKQIIVNEQKEQIEARDILEDKKSSLETLKNEKQRLIDELNSDIKALEREEKKKEADYEALQRELNAALSSSSSSPSTASYSGGAFCWPSAASTKITSNYGYRIHPISGAKKLHRGIDIGAGLGTNVLAAEGGKVLTAGWNNSYGYYITINHGGGLVTLYAHNSKLLVSKGDNVTRGQVIAKCGSTGNSTGPHIHFEVQKNGSLQNPMNYF